MTVTVTMTEQGTDAGEVSTSKAKSRWPVRTVALLVVAAVIVLVALMSWAWSYQPLISGTYTGVIGGQGTEVRTIQNSFGTDYRVVRAEPGSTVTVLMSLYVSPEAPAGVTVNSVGSPAPLTGGDVVSYADSAETSSRLEVDREVGNLADGPVSLEPGDLLRVTITLTLPRCDRDRTPGGWSGFGNDVAVNYSAFGISHTTNMPLGYALTFGDTPTCPAR